MGRGRAGPGRRAEARTPARPTPCRSGPARAGTSCATWTRPTTKRFVDPENERYWMGPQSDRRQRRRRPVRRRRRARRAAPAVRPVLAQGAVRPGPRLVVRAVPAPVQPGLHPGVRVHRRPRRLRAGRGGRGARRRLLLRRRAGQPRVRQDGQVAEERGDARTTCAPPTAPTRSGSTRCRWARWTCPGRGRPGPSSARTGSCSGSGALVVDEETGAARVVDAPVGRRDPAAAAPDDRRGPRRHGGAALQHRDRQADRADQPGHRGLRRRHAARGWPSRWC